jgi:hypothetical protein
MALKEKILEVVEAPTRLPWSYACWSAFGAVHGASTDFLI